MSSGESCVSSSEEEDSANEYGSKVTCVSTNSISHVHIGDVTYYGKQKKIHSVDSNERKAHLTDLRKKMSTMLQLRYQNANLPPVPWLDDQLFPVEDFFVELSLVKKNKSGKHINQPIKLKNILESDKGKSPTRILIEGGPGYGKTTITKKLAYDWATESFRYLNSFDLVFVVRLRTLQKNLFSLILEEGRLKNVNKKTIRDAILLHPEKVLLILDGYDEMNASHRSEVLEDPSLLLMTVIMTSRPSEVSDLRKTFQKNILVQGISEVNREMFMKNYLHSLKLPEKNFSELQNYLKDNTLDELCVCPLLLSLICLLVTDKDFSLPQTKTELYQNFLDFIVKRSLGKINFNSCNVDLFGRNGEATPVRVVRVLKKFGDFLLQKLTEHQIIFTEEEILLSTQKDPLILQLGVLYKNDVIINRKVVTHIEPIHITFLEFLAGYALIDSDMKDKHMPLAYWHPLAFIFMAGLTGNRFSEIPHPSNPTLLLNMLIESQDPFNNMKILTRSVRSWNLQLCCHPSGLRTVSKPFTSPKIPSLLYRKVEKEYIKYILQNDYLMSFRIEFTEEKDSSEEFELKKYVPDIRTDFMVQEITIYVSKSTSANGVIASLRILRPKMLRFSVTEEYNKSISRKFILKSSFFGKMLKLFRKENLRVTELKFINASLTRKDILHLVKVLIDSQVETLFLHGLNIYSSAIYLNLTPLFSILEQPICMLRELHLLYVNIFQKDVDNLCVSAGRSQTLAVLEFCTSKIQNLELIKLCNNGLKEWESVTVQFFKLILPEVHQENILRIQKLISHNTISDSEEKEKLKSRLESCGVKEAIIS